MTGHTQPQRLRLSGETCPELVEGAKLSRREKIASSHGN